MDARVPVLVLIGHVVILGSNVAGVNTSFHWDTLMKDAFRTVTGALGAGKR